MGIHGCGPPAPKTSTRTPQMGIRGRNVPIAQVSTWPSPIVHVELLAVSCCRGPEMLQWASFLRQPRRSRHEVAAESRRTTVLPRHYRPALRHPAVRHNLCPLDSRRPAMPGSGGLAAHLGQGLPAAEPRRRHDRAVSFRAASVLPGQRPDRRRTGGDGRLVAAGRRAAAVVAGDLYSRDSRRGTLPYGEFSRRVPGIPAAASPA